MNKNIIKSIIGFSIISIFLKGCTVQDIKFNVDISKYSKEDTSEYTYEIDGDTLVINSDSSSISIKKNNTDDVQVRIDKSVGGNDEEKLQEALDNIKSECDKDTIDISCPSFQGSDFSSMNNKTEIIIPKTISNLKIKNDVGDITLEGNYQELNLDCKTGDLLCDGSIEDLKIDSNVGDISLNGDVKKCSIDSNVGDINLDLDNIKDDYNYLINGNVGDLRVKMPKGERIQLRGDSKNKAKVSEEIQSSDEGAVFDIDMEISDVVIEAV